MMIKLRNFQRSQRLLRLHIKLIAILFRKQSNYDPNLIKQGIDEKYFANLMNVNNNNNNNN